MKTCMAGPEGTAYPDQEIDVGKDKANELIKGGFAIPLEIIDDKDDTYPKHIAGGLYLLSNGSKVKGKELAVEAENALSGVLG